MTRTLLASSLLLVVACSGAAEPPEVRVSDAEQGAPTETIPERPPPVVTASATAKGEDGSPEDLPTGGVEVKPNEHKEKRHVFQAFTTSEGDASLAQAEVARAFDENASKLSACLSVDSVLKIKLKVSPSGRVTDAQVLSAAPDAPRLRDCVAATLRALSFSKLQGKEPVTLVMDVALKKGST